MFFKCILQKSPTDLSLVVVTVCIHPWIQRGDRGLGPPIGKSQVAICFFRNTGTDPLEKQLDLRSNCYSREVRRSCVKYVDDKKKTLPGDPWQNFLDPRMAYQEDKSKTITNENQIKSIDCLPLIACQHMRNGSFMNEGNQTNQINTCLFVEGSMAPGSQMRSGPMSPVLTSISVL